MNSKRNSPPGAAREMSVWGAGVRLFRPRFERPTPPLPDPAPIPEPVPEPVPAPDDPVEPVLSGAARRPGGRELP